MHMRPGGVRCDAAKLRDGLCLYIPSRPRRGLSSAATESPVRGRHVTADKPPSKRWKCGGGRGDAAAALRRKVRQLRRLVPGGEDAPAESLFLRAAEYIARLRAQVELLRALTALCSAATPPAQLSTDVDDDEVCMMD